ncbi:hypothetical protein niasHS_004509 [Heterodera schachtii]|uniref:BTB domain-containing protein n=1 Tax=Heterodera schachtii TaxID=97005 RepID=A0ABD2JMZ6_HETSC
MKVLLGTTNGADIHFLVGEEKKLFRAHKCILMLASDAFEAMFRFDEKNATDKVPSGELPKPVEVPDIEAAAFKVMLSFIYADDLSELGGENAMAVLYAAKKYNIPGLIGQCLEKIPISNLPNVFLAHSQALLFDLEDFARKCLLYICQNAETLFITEEFLQIDQNLLCELFERDQLLMNNEFELWQAALRWADEKCRQNGIECSAANRRSALGPALFKIRFPLIPLLKFEKEIAPLGLLSMQEVLSVVHSHANFRDLPGQFPLKFPRHVRCSDWNIPRGDERGTLALEIEKFSEFAREEIWTSRESEVKVYLKELPWKILAEIKMSEQSNEKCLAFSLLCAAPLDKSWSCICSATFRIVSQKSGTEDLKAKISANIFYNNSIGREFPNFISVEELMDPSRGFYDKNEDKVTLAIDVIVEERKTETIKSKSNKSNGTIEMQIDKLSEFARENFGSERSSETVQMKGLSWKIAARIGPREEGTGKCLGFFLSCTAVEEDGYVSCKCSATFRIVSQKNGADDLTRKFVEDSFISPDYDMPGFSDFISFSELMDPSSGLYDEQENKVKLAVDFRVEEADLVASIICK